MQHPTINKIRECICTLNYVISIHATNAMEDDNITIFDIENIILTGEIIERQRDFKTREVKCIIRGVTKGLQHAEIVIKIGPLGQLFIITVYRI